MVRFEVSPLFLETYREKTQGHGAVVKKFEEFRAAKTANPIQPWGSNDRPMKSHGLFSNAVPGILKAHLTHDISVVYTVRGVNPTVVRLYGLFTHDDLGVGSPPNINKQKSMSRNLANQQFGGEEMFPAGPETDQSEKSTEPQAAGTRPDYTPKARPATPPAPTQTSPLAALAQQIDRSWPQRNFVKRFGDARDRNAQLAVINGEVDYLQKIMRSGRLYSNQQDYARGLQQLYAQITQRQP